MCSLASLNESQYLPPSRVPAPDSRKLKIESGQGGDVIEVRCRNPKPTECHFHLDRRESRKRGTTALHDPVTLNTLTSRSPTDKRFGRWSSDSSFGQHGRDGVRSRQDKRGSLTPGRNKNRSSHTVGTRERPVPEPVKMVSPSREILEVRDESKRILLPRFPSPRLQPHGETNDPRTP